MIGGGAGVGIQAHLLVMTTRRQAILEACRQLQEAGIPSPNRELEWFLLEAANCRRIDLIMDADAELAQEAAEKFNSYVERRLNHEPVQYILGHTEFFGLRFHVNPNVLIPRPETETLVEHALEFVRMIERPRIVDVGTGSGCIAVAIGSVLPDARITGVDIDEDILGVARANGAVNRVDVEWIEGDYHGANLVGVVGRGVDLMISNPPYIPASEESVLDPEVRLFEPPEALFPGDDHLSAYRSIGRLAAETLKRGGGLFTEVHENHANEVAAVFEKAGLVDISVHQDLVGKDRVVSARARSAA